MLEIISVTPAPKPSEANARPSNKVPGEAATSQDGEQSFDAEYASKSEADAEQVEPDAKQSASPTDEADAPEQSAHIPPETDPDAPAPPDFAGADQPERKKTASQPVEGTQELQAEPAAKTPAAETENHPVAQGDTAHKAQFKGDPQKAETAAVMASSRAAPDSPTDRPKTAAPAGVEGKSRKQAASTAETIITSKTLNQTASASPGDAPELAPQPKTVLPQESAVPAENDGAQISGRKEPQPVFKSPEAVVTRKADRQTDLSDAKVQEIRVAPKAPVQQTPPPSIAPVLAVKPTLQLSGDKAEKTILTGSDIDTAFWEPRPGGQTTTSSLSQIITKPETPAMIGRQLAEALQRMPDRPVELSLNPSELGRVRMSISAGEAGITVSVMTERPETLDLMRRNIDDLAREFKELGYESISFAFAEGHHNQSHGEDSASDSSTASIVLSYDEEAQPPTPISTSVASGLDLRL